MFADTLTLLLAVSHQKCTTALIKAKCIPLCSVLFCRTGSQQACVTPITPMEICSSTKVRLTPGLCHCNHTFGDLLFVQVGNDSTPMHCSYGQGKMYSPLFSSALQHRLTAGLCHSNHTCCSSQRCAVSQQKCTAALVKAKCIPLCSVVVCKTGSQQACDSAITPLEICYSYRCSVSQQKCTAALVWAECILHCLVLLCKTGLCHYNHTWRFALHTSWQ